MRFRSCDTQSPDELPTEFAHAFRFGHAMVRPNYVFNDLNGYGEDLADMMLATSGGRPWRMPLDETWMAQWSRFFEIGTTKAQSQPTHRTELLGRAVFRGSVRPHRRDGERGLGLQGPLEQRVHSAMVGSCAGCRDPRRNGRRLPSSRRCCRDDRERERQIGDWLGRHRLANGLNDEDIGISGLGSAAGLLCPVRGRPRDGRSAPRRFGLADPRRDPLSRARRRPRCKADGLAPLPIWLVSCSVGPRSHLPSRRACRILERWRP